MPAFQPVEVTDQPPSATMYPDERMAEVERRGRAPERPGMGLADSRRVGARSAQCQTLRFGPKSASPPTFPIPFTPKIRS
jgi:hypothetical protein